MKGEPMVAEAGKKRDRGVRRKILDSSGGDDHHNPRIAVVKKSGGGSDTSSRAKTKMKMPGRQQGSAAKELIGAATLYWLCISAPAIIGFIVRVYEEHILGVIDAFQSHRLAADDGGMAEQQGVEEMTYYDTLSSYASYYSSRAASYACGYMATAEWCGMDDDAGEDESGFFATVRRHLYRDSTPLNDLLLVMTSAMILAIVRVLLVSLLVPRALAPQRLAAMTRCKSTHILSSSSSYEFSPAVKRKNNVGGSLRNNLAALAAPDLGGSEDETDDYTNQMDLEDSAEDDDARIALFSERVGSRIQDSIRRSLGHEPVPAAEYENLDTTAAQRIFSAPRFATAIFRCLYCSASCLMAYSLFRTANFWPVYVGGLVSSSTRNCWDRSGSIAIGSLDSDFDHNNAALHIFFLAQGAYQLHSLWFHVLSMALLLLYEEGNERMISMKTSMKSYLRPLAEHLISLTLIFLCYIFSGLRRLGAVGIFTLESSSISLQLLQVCINAPESSPLRRPKFVKRLHRYLVVPSFLYCRFFVFPFIVWYSAAFESQDWLEQIEKAFIPGSAFVLYVIFNLMISFIFGLNLVFFRRLLFHPHLQDIFRQAREE